ncbi:MAG: glycosyltransferase [Candidatus Saccharibacteria bacterium]|nr:glycosyltransferase [Candidatus Saccharibacteria bacterium]
MRIGLFTDYFLPHTGGTETSVYHQYRALVNEGHEVFVITPPAKGSQHQTVKDENLIQIPNRGINFRRHGLDILIYNPKALDQVKKLNLDVIHTQTEFGIGILARKFAWSVDKPMIYTGHTFYPQFLSGKFSDKIASVVPLLMQKAKLGSAVHLRLKNMSKDFEGIASKTKEEQFVLKYWLNYANLADHIIAPSKRMQDFMEYYLPRKHISFIPNPFEGAKVLPKPVAITDRGGKIKIVWAGRVTAEKRPDVFIKSLLKLDSQLKNKIRVDVFGEGDMLPTLKNEVHKSNWAQTIHFHGNVDNLVVQASFKCSDLLVISSHGFDNQPMVILEALSAGLGIVYCDSGLKEGLNRHNSELIGPDPADFARILSKLINDRRRVDTMKMSSKSLADDFSYEKFNSHYSKILKSLA